MAPDPSKRDAGTDNSNEDESVSLGAKSANRPPPGSHANNEASSTDNSLGDTSRVRFSVELPRVLDDGVQSKEPRAALQKPAGILKSSSGRNRGYSLRRSLFAQNIQKSSDTGGAFEMDSSRSSAGTNKPKDSEDGLEPRSTTVPIEEAEEESDRTVTKPIRLSDPDLESPIYRQ